MITAYNHYVEERMIDHNNIACWQEIIKVNYLLLKESSGRN